MEIIVLQTGPLAVNTCIVNLDGKNVFVLDPADCDFSGDRFLVRDYLEKNGLNPVALIFSHGHFDHVSGLKDLKSFYPDAKVLIHKNDKDFIGKESLKIQGMSLDLMGFDEFLPWVTNLPESDGFLEDGQTLGQIHCLKNLSPSTLVALNKWKIIHTPGHTPGCICLYNKEDKTLLAGDTIFYHSWGRTDLPLGSESTIQQSLEKIYRTLPPETKVYPGHERFGFCLSENYGSL